MEAIYFGNAHWHGNSGAVTDPENQGPWVGADLEQKFPEERLEGTPCVKLSTKSGSNAYLPANFVLQAMSGDGTLRCKKDGSKTDLTPEQLDWHGIVEHITSTWKTWSVQ